MAITPNMNLDLPTVSVTLGPEWATDLNTALTSIDEHDHSSGKGIKITPAGLNINTSLDMQTNTLLNINLANFANLGSPSSGASNARSLNVSGGDLYYVNGAGISVQVTSGSALTASPATVSSYDITNVVSNITIGALDTFVVLIVDTTSPREITLPLANSVSTGRFYILKDKNGSARTNSITLKVQGSDTLEGSTSDFITDSNFTSLTMVGDGTSAWYII